MAFFIGLLTFVMVLNCAVLILLVLMQLPKKDAGAGLAFGGGATDALFGAGSGNVLTKATKYSATLFFVLALVIGILQSNYRHQSVANLIKATATAPAGTPETGPAGAGSAATPTPVPQTPAALPAASNFMLETKEPAAATTNPPAEQ